jgi:hypothetical protein
MKEDELSSFLPSFFFFATHYNFKQLYSIRDSTNVHLKKKNLRKILKTKKDLCKKRVKIEGWEVYNRHRINIQVEGGDFTIDRE